MVGIKVKDSSVKKSILKGIDEEISVLKSAYNSGRYTSQQYKERKSYLMRKKASVRSGNYIL